MQKITSLPYLKSFSGPISNKAKDPTLSMLCATLGSGHLLPTSAAVCTTPCSQWSSWPYRITCQIPNKPCVFTAALLHTSPWKGMVYPCIYLVNSYPLFHVQLKLNSLSWAFSDLARRMCSKNLWSFRGNETELEEPTCSLPSRFLFALFHSPNVGGGGGVWLSYVVPGSYRLIT